MEPGETATETKTCRFDGCETKLRADNGLGFCQKHRCRSERNRAFSRLYHQRQMPSDEARAGRRAWGRRNWSRRAVSQARSRDPMTDLTPEWVLEQFEAQGRRCFYVPAWKLDPEAPPRSGFKPSLDRIDNTKWYTKDNVRVTSWFWNRLRGTDSIEDTLAVIALLRAVVEPA